MLLIAENQTITPKLPGVFLEKEEFDAVLENAKTQEQENSNLKIDVQYYKHELDKLKRLIFGQTSERYVSNTSNENQLSLSLEITVRPAEEKQTETVAYTRTKPNNNKELSHGRSPLPENLPRQEITIEPEVDLTGAKKIGENITEVLEYILGRLYVKKYIRPKYVLADDKGIVTAELPLLPIPRGNAGASLLAYLIISKYVDHLPF